MSNATVLVNMNSEPSVRSIDAAMNWFLENGQETVLCIGDDGDERRCGDFDEAREFFIEHNKSGE